MEVKDIYKQLYSLGACSKFTGRETLPELFALFTTPQGLEFYQKTGFPTIEIIRQFSGSYAQAAGVYIDAGSITLHGERKVVLVGDTQATLTYNDNAEYRHEVIVMHGAAADVKASNWAVVFINNLGGDVETTTQDNAIIR